nr:hypothetical protein [Methanobacterium formicicum]
MDIISGGITIIPSEIGLLFMVSAFILGALHALEPGHGKSVMAAFVLGTDANLKDAWLLGLTVVFFTRECGGLTGSGFHFPHGNLEC